MNTPKILLCIAVMAAVTYIPRVFPLAVFRKKIVNRWVRSFLAYMPYAVLAAMTIPEVFYSTENLISGIIGCAVGFLLAFFRRSLLLVAAGEPPKGGRMRAPDGMAAADLVIQERRYA